MFVTRGKSTTKLAERFTSNAYEFHRCKVIAETDGPIGLALYDKSQRESARAKMCKLSQENFTIVNEVESRSMFARMNFRNSVISCMSGEEMWQVFKNYIGQMVRTVFAGFPLYTIMCIVTAFEEFKALTVMLFVGGAGAATYFTIGNKFMKAIDEAQEEIFETFKKMGV